MLSRRVNIDCTPNKTTPMTRSCRGRGKREEGKKWRKRREEDKNKKGRRRKKKKKTKRGEGRPPPPPSSFLLHLLLLLDLVIIVLCVLLHLHHHYSSSRAPARLPPKCESSHSVTPSRCRTAEGVQGTRDARTLCNAERAAVKKGFRKQMNMNINRNINIVVVVQHLVAPRPTEHAKQRTAQPEPAPPALHARR